MAYNNIQSLQWSPTKNLLAYIFKSPESTDILKIEDNSKKDPSKEFSSKFKQIKLFKWSRDGKFLAILWENVGITIISPSSNSNNDLFITYPEFKVETKFMAISATCKTVGIIDQENNLIIYDINPETYEITNSKTVTIDKTITAFTVKSEIVDNYSLLEDKPQYFLGSKDGYFIAISESGDIKINDYEVDRVPKAFNTAKERIFDDEFKRTIYYLMANDYDVGYDDPQEESRHRSYASIVMGGKSVSKYFKKPIDIGYGCLSTLPETSSPPAKFLFAAPNHMLIFFENGQIYLSSESTMEHIHIYDKVLGLNEEKKEIPTSISMQGSDYYCENGHVMTIGTNLGRVIIYSFDDNEEIFPCIIMINNVIELDPTKSIEVAWNSSGTVLAVSDGDMLRYYTPEEIIKKWPNYEMEDTGLLDGREPPTP